MEYLILKSTEIEPNSFISIYIVNLDMLCNLKLYKVKISIVENSLTDILLKKLLKFY